MPASDKSGQTEQGSQVVSLVDPSFKGVTWAQLTIVIVFSLMGFSAGVIFVGHSDDVTSFTTIQVIGFVLSVLVSGGSIVLAIAAIALGKSSEYAMILRSDQSIRLQNDIFARTTDALQRIESSTGVTEKRIEDIIAGRLGDISEDIARRASRGESPEKLQAHLRDAIRANVAPHDEKEEWRRRLESERQAKEYHEAHDKLQVALANAESVTTLKVGHGSPNPEKGSPYDGLYVVNDKRVAVTTFRPGTFLPILTIFVDYAVKLIEEKKIDRYVFVLFETDIEGAELEAERLIRTISLMRSEFSAAMTVLRAKLEDAEEIAKQISQP